MKRRNDRMNHWQMPRFTLALVCFARLACLACLACLALVLALAACATDQPLPADEPAAPRPVQLNVQIGTLTGTRAPLPGTIFPHESQINVVMVDFGGGTTNHNKAIPYIYKNPTGAAGVWMPLDLDHPLVADNKDAQLLMHYPATLPTGSTLSADKRTLTPVVTHTADLGDLTAGTYNGQNSFFVTLKTGEAAQEVFLADGETDYMTGGTDAACNSSNPLATIKMHHALCMLVFHIYKVPENTNPGAVTSILIENVNASTGPLCKGTFLLKDRTFTPAADRVNYQRTMLNFPDGSYYGLMVYPATLATGTDVRVKFTIDGQVYPLSLPARTWQSGSVVLYNVKLKATEAELGDNVGLIDWATGTTNEFVIE